MAILPSMLMVGHCSPNCLTFPQCVHSLLERAALLLCSGCYDGNVYTLDARVGAVVWTFTTGGAVKCSPTVHPDTGAVYVGSHDHCLYALDIKVTVVVVVLHSSLADMKSDSYHAND